MNKTLGAALLIAGCSIGTGMLGVPVVTGAAGLLPTVILFVAAYLFMMATGLLLGRLTLSFPRSEINLITMAEETLGRVAKICVYVLFAALFYAVLIGYTIASGRLVMDFAALIGVNIPFTLAVTLVVLALYVVVIRGIRFVDETNRFLMAGLIISYLLLVTIGLPYVEVDHLQHIDFAAGWGAFPILIISFGYHNLVPTLVHYLEKDAKALKRAIIIGCTIPLGVYVLWEIVLLGVIPRMNRAEWQEIINQGQMITQVLSDLCRCNYVVQFSRSFAFFAIATSFLPVVFSFIDFLRDGRHVHDSKKNRILYALYVLLPPCVIALTKPHVFLVALNYAGGFCAVVLFGLLPVLMSWKRNIVSKGKLIVLFIASVVILTMTILHEANVI